MARKCFYVRSNSHLVTITGGRGFRSRPCLYGNPEPKDSQTKKPTPQGPTRASVRRKAWSLGRAVGVSCRWELGSLNKDRTPSSFSLLDNVRKAE